MAEAWIRERRAFVVGNVTDQEGRPAPEASKPWSPRAYRKSDEQGVLELLQATFGRWPEVEIAVDPIDHLRWKLASTEDAWRYHVVTESKGKIVGLRLFVLQPVMVNGEPLRARQEVDACVHPDFQRQGLTSAMWYGLSDGLPRRLDLDLCVASGHPAWSRIEWRDWEPFTMTMDVLVCLAPLPAPTGRGQDGWTITQPLKFDERIDAFWLQAWKPYEFIVARTRDYLNWRYCDERAGQFTLRTLEQEGQVLGYAVLRRSHGVGCIADLLVLPKGHDVLQVLIEDALSYFQKANVSRIECWLPPEHPYVGVLKGCGFSRKRREIRFHCQPHHAPASKFQFLASPGSAAVHLTAGDTDLV